jgi:hypothetical protein
MGNSNSGTVARLEGALSVAAEAASQEEVELEH